MAPPPPLEPPPPYTPLLIPLLSPSTSSSVLPTLGTLVQLQVTLEALRSHALTKRKAVVEQQGAVAGFLEGEREADRVRGRKKEERERKDKEKKDAERKGSSTPGPKGVKVERGASPAVGPAASPLTPIPSPASRPSTPQPAADSGESDASSLALSKTKNKRKRGLVVSDNDDDQPLSAKLKGASTPVGQTIVVVKPPAVAAAAASDGSTSRPPSEEPTSSSLPMPKFTKKKDKDKSREPSVAGATTAGGTSRATTPTPATSAGPSSMTKPSTPVPPTLEKKSATPGPAASVPVVPKIKLSISSAARAVSPLASTAPASTPASAAATTPPTAAGADPLPLPPLGSHIDFRLPLATRSLVPPRPPIPDPLPPLPLTQIEVNDDFTQVKAPGTQLLFSNFMSSAEAYTRAVGEEDLAFLKGYKEEDVEPYVVPPLGQHYTHQFAEEDRLAAQGLPYVPPLAGTAAAGGVNRSLEYPRMRKSEFGFDPLEGLTEEGLVEERGMGPVSERVVGGLVDARGESLDEFTLQASAGTGPSSSRSRREERRHMMMEEGGAGERERTTLGKLEDRLKGELQLVGLLGDEPIDWSQRADDEISTSLRQCQKLLATQTALNMARKSILLSIAKDRLAYSEYQQCLDGLDRVIESAWAKRQKIVQRQQKRKANAVQPGTSVRINSKERERDDKEREQQKLLMETVRRSMDRRKMLVEHVGGLFKEEEEEDPGRFFGMPKTSVYEGLRVVDACAQEMEGVLEQGRT